MHLQSIMFCLGFVASLGTALSAKASILDENLRELNSVYASIEANRATDRRTDTEALLKSDAAHLSIAIYKQILSTELDRQAGAAMHDRSYRGQRIEQLASALTQAKTSGAEILSIMDLVLTKGPLSRAVFALQLNDEAGNEAIVELARALVRLSSPKQSRAFFEKLDRLAVETKDFFYNSIHDGNFLRIATTMLAEARKTPGKEQQVTEILLDALSRVSMKSKVALIYGLAESRSPSVYATVKMYSMSENPDLRRASLQTWHRARDPVATEDLIHTVKRIERGNIPLERDLSTAIFNKVGADLDRAYETDATREDKIATEKMRELVLEMLGSKHVGLRSLMAPKLAKQAFTDAEVDAHISKIASHSVANVRWSVPRIVDTRKMVTPNSIRALKRLENDSDADLSSAAREALERTRDRVAAGKRMCRAIFTR